MAKIVLTANLRKYFPQKDLTVDGNTVLEVLTKMEELSPHFRSYILDEHNAIRKHVNIFLDGKY